MATDFIFIKRGPNSIYFFRPILFALYNSFVKKEVLVRFLIFFLNSEVDEEEAEKRACAIINEMKKQGELQKIIKEACELSEEALVHFGRGGKRGFISRLS